MGTAACGTAANSVIVGRSKGVRKAKKQGDHTRGYNCPRLKDSFDLLLHSSRRAGVLLADHARLFGLYRHNCENGSTVTASEGRGTAILVRFVLERDSASGVRGLYRLRDLPVSDRTLAYTASVQAVLSDHSGPRMPGNSVWNGSWHFHVSGVESSRSEAAFWQRAASMGTTRTAAESVT